MKVGLFLFALLVVGGFTAPPSGAQQTHQGTTKTAAKPAPAGSVGGAASRRGIIGGPVSKGAKINGTDIRPKH
jgi:hypothetical protein